jgi:hypothetical protein
MLSWEGYRIEISRKTCQNKVESKKLREKVSGIILCNFYSFSGEQE